MNICKNAYELISANLVNILQLRGKRMLKEDGSYVTKGDLLCQRLVIDYVKSVPDTFEIVSEEMHKPGFMYDVKKNYAVLDPIDGTENFTSGLKEWGISLSIFKHGKHAESMIAMPELNICLLTGGKIPKHKSRICGLSSSFPKKQIRSLPDGTECRIMGCCVYNLYNVITGSFASFQNNKGAHAWDILAGLNLALEHGLDVLVDGKKYRGEFLPPIKKYPFHIRQKYTQYD